MLVIFYTTYPADVWGDFTSKLVCLSKFLDEIWQERHHVERESCCLVRVNDLEMCVHGQLGHEVKGQVIGHRWCETLWKMQLTITLIELWKGIVIRCCATSGQDEKGQFSNETWHQSIYPIAFTTYFPSVSAHCRQAKHTHRHSQAYVLIIIVWAHCAYSWLKICARWDQNLNCDWI